jgi:D-glycero-D-manno-heptose 1,7-bisphosphate phosphatase
MPDSWFIGDQDSDILCGQSLGLRTILINENDSNNKRGKILPDFKAENLEDAVKIISENKNLINRAQINAETTD